VQVPGNKRAKAASSVAIIDPSTGKARVMLDRLSSNDELWCDPLGRQFRMGFRFKV
jgi:hypothetical protein